MSAFLDLERLGLATSYYPKSVLAARRREAKSLGFGSNDSGMADLDVELESLLLPYREAFGDAGSAREASLAQASGAPAQDVAPEIVGGVTGDVTHTVRSEDDYLFAYLDLAGRVCSAPARPL